MAKPLNQRHLYEIHTAPQGEIIKAVMSAESIVEIVRLREFLLTVVKPDAKAGFIYRLATSF
jgi:hypothetical protein